MFVALGVLLCRFLRARRVNGCGQFLAHEAIRPVDVTITPDEVKPHLPPEQFNLYRLVWSRFVASQMAGARFHDTTAAIACAHTQWKAKGERLLFPGFLAAM